MKVGDKGHSDESSLQLERCGECRGADQRLTGRSGASFDLPQAEADAKAKELERQTKERIQDRHLVEARTCKHVSSCFIQVTKQARGHHQQKHAMQKQRV